MPVETSQDAHTTSKEGDAAATRIGSAGGKELVVDGAVNDVADQVIAGQPFSVIDSSGGRVYVFQAHVAYIEEGVARQHPYQRRGMLRGN